MLDVAIVNVALPSIRTDLHFSQESLQWVITAYAIFFGGVLLLGGRLADLVGLRRLFLVGLALFTVTSPERRAALRHRHLDIGGAVSITGGLMLLVYAMTRATQHGWATPGTIGLLVAFSQFFLLTLYMQQVLHYSVLKTGVAYISLTLSIIVFSAISQALVTRIGIRRVLPVGLALSTAALVLFAQLPVHGDYFSDLFPAFLLSGVGLALAFVPMSIGALTGVRPADAGIASGLINTSQQIGGAIDVALATTIATTVTSHYVQGHAGTTAFTEAALTHGFAIAFYVLAALAALGAVLAAVMLESRSADADARPPNS